MSIDQNKAIVHRYQEAYNAGNLDALDEIVAADIITHAQDPSVPLGLEGGKQIHQQTLSGFPDPHFHIEDLIAEDDKVAARFTATATEKDSGKIVEHWANQDDLGWYQQLGIAAPSGQDQEAC